MVTEQNDATESQIAEHRTEPQLSDAYLHISPTLFGRLFRPENEIEPLFVSQHTHANSDAALIPVVSDCSLSLPKKVGGGR